MGWCSESNEINLSYSDQTLKLFKEMNQIHTNKYQKEIKQLSKRDTNDEEDDEKFKEDTME